jgi:hypothetical protein
MIGTVVGLVEFIGLVMAAWIIGEFLIRGVTAHHSDSPWAQGLAAATGG